jgi:hypothetical protein
MTTSADALKRNVSEAIDRLTEELEQQAKDDFASGGGTTAAAGPGDRTGGANPQSRTGGHP